MSKRSEGSTNSKGKPKKKEKGRSKHSTREVTAVDQRPPYDKSKGPSTKRRQGGHSNDRTAPQSVSTPRGNEHWCPFHKIPGHDLRNCRTWQKQMEDYYDGKGPIPVQWSKAMTRTRRCRSKERITTSTSSTGVLPPTHPSGSTKRYGGTSTTLRSHLVVQNTPSGQRPP